MRDLLTWFILVSSPLPPLHSLRIVATPPFCHSLHTSLPVHRCLVTYTLFVSVPACALLPITQSGSLPTLPHACHVFSE